MRYVWLIIIFLLPSLAGAQQLVKYRYWYDHDFDSKQTVNSTSTTIDLALDVTNLGIGFHELNFQSQDNNNQWSPVVTSYFSHINVGGVSLLGYRYWFDDKFDSAKTVVSTDTTVNLAFNVDNLSLGFHQLNIQWKDVSGKWSSVLTQNFLHTQTKKNTITKMRYWFDNNFANAKERFIGSNTDDIVANIDIDAEELSLGIHQVNYDFRDAGGLWSSVVTDYFTRVPITSKIFIEPKVLVKKSLVTIGDIQTITGKDFTSSGQINLFVQNSIGDFMPTNSSFVYLPNGSFSYQLPVTSSMPGGEYKVYATDVNTGRTTPIIKFKVNSSLTKQLWINEPNLSGSYTVNKSVKINWSDFITATAAIGKSGFVQKRYKIEYSNDNAATWQIIESSHIFNAVQSNQTNPFTSEFTFLAAGNYTIKVTDLDNASGFNTSKFVVIANTINGFTTSLEWDHSLPNRTDHPVGMAADGTARIFVKLSRDAGNTKLVKEIDEQISPLNASDTSTGIIKLGKIMYANDTINYSIEANTAYKTFDNKIFTSPSSFNNFSFWLVAPDDFCQDLKNQDAERTIQVSIKVIYSDNTFIIRNEVVRIVRPPVMFVHGLNGSAESFANTRYNIDGINTRFFKYAGGPDELFKNSFMILNLKNYASFKDNADILLGIGDIAYRPQSFQRFLKQMHVLGFAANRVDYVCHSMGGSIARTVMSSQYDGSFKPSVQSGLKYKNYDKGFINKLITINTPNNGSPVADFMADFFKPGNGMSQYIKNSLVGAAYNRIDFFKGFFQKTGAIGYADLVGNFDLYDVSPAVKDLQATHNGIIFKTTKVKNHLIGGNIDEHGILSDADFIGQLHNTESVKILLNLMNSLLPRTKKIVDVITAGPDLIYKINNYVDTHYGYYQFLSNSDFIVPTSSQFPAINILSIPDIDKQLLTKYSASIGYGISRNHITVTDDLVVGTKLMQLLNSSINSTYFADQIAPNTNSNAGGTTYKNNVYSKISTLSEIDSVRNYVDTNYIKILSPLKLSSLFVDSTVSVNLHLKDTSNLQRLQMVFQGEYYESYSKISNQTFNLKVHSDAIGYNQIVVDGVYDSSGYTINHTDTATVLVKSLDTLKGFYTSPKTQNLNRKQIFHPVYNAVYSSYIGILNENIDSLNFSIADTNVVKYIDSLREFTTKDTGTTYIVYNYKGIVDTGFIYLSEPQQNPNISFSGKVYLQGAYNTSTVSMNNTLNALGILQLNASAQPYNSAGLKYIGTENVSAGFFTSHPDIVDWVFLELRDSASPSTVIATRAAFVKQDGSLIETDGSNTQIIFNDVPLGSYYVAIRHRNHLGIRSSTVIDFSSGSGIYDFTTSANKAYQNQSYTSTVQMGNIWAMRAGNANSNNNVKYNGPANDQNQILNVKLAGSLSNILNNIYAPEDINMNGNVKWNGPGNDQNFLLNTILQGSLSTIYVEQL